TSRAGTSSGWTLFTPRGRGDAVSQTANDGSFGRRVTIRCDIADPPGCPAMNIDIGSATHRLSCVFLGVATALTACATDELGEDGRDDAFTSDGKLDGFQCTPAEAAAILQVVNTASGAVLRNDVQLPTKAADNIVAYRVGDDEVAHTNDDETFGTL